jgi:serpin B
VQSLDFNSPSAPATINAWVKGATNGKIPSIVGAIPSDVILYLIDAVYFHAQWAYPFPTGATHMQPFTTANGSSTQVRMMSESATLAYEKGSNFESVTLPYKGGRFTMSVVLPSPGVSLQSLVAAATPTTFKSWTAGQHRAFGSISLPRVSLTNDFQLAGPLSKLGMGTAFSQRADFSAMCTTPCRLSQARQKTYLDVDENGTTAAAVTSVGVSPTAIQPSGFAMVVNRPFLLSINDTTTGATLFVGAVYSPE